MRTRAVALLIALAVAFCGLLPAAAQNNLFPQTLAPNTVVGRTGIGPGPAQAIPFSQVIQTLNISPNTWTGLQTFNGGMLSTALGQFGPLPFVQALNYMGGSATSGLLGVRGSVAVPVTDSLPVALFQSTSSVASGAGQTLYASLVKRNTAAGIDNRTIWAECNDQVGGGSIACGRFSGLLSGGTGGNGTGVTSVMACLVSYAFCLGTEAQVFNNVADASTSFSSAAFETAMLLSNPGTKKSFAGIMTNPNWTIPFINGFYVGAGTVQDSVVRSDAASAHGINLLNATCSIDCFRSPNFLVDGSGNLAANSILNASNHLLISPAAPTIGACGGGSPAISAHNGPAAFRVTVGSATSTCVVNLPTAATGWNCYATDLTTNSTTVFITKQVTPSATNAATLGNFNDVAAAANWATSDVLAVSCFAL